MIFTCVTCKTVILLLVDLSVNDTNDWAELAERYGNPLLCRAFDIPPDEMKVDIVDTRIKISVPVVSLLRRYVISMQLSASCRFRLTTYILCGAIFVAPEAMFTIAFLKPFKSKFGS